MEYITKLITSEKIAEDTMAFRIFRPSGFNYKAGQYVDLTIINPKETDEGGSTRSFSLASSPHEDELLIVTRMRDSTFKRNLYSLRNRAEIKITEPMGRFFLHEDESKSAVFLVGGIGITPVRSILFDAFKNNKKHQFYLFYSNHRPEDAAFLEDWQQAEKEHENFKLIATMTTMEKSAQQWTGETSRIDMALIKKYIADATRVIFYIVGPAGMVKAMVMMLEQAGISPDNIKAEDFSGY